ncbi:hypothetical protein C0992_011646, partial [Termitomyces sp. T32_za158]
SLETSSNSAIPQFYAPYYPEQTLAMETSTVSVHTSQRMSSSTSAGIASSSTASPKASYPAQEDIVTIYERRSKLVVDALSGFLLWEQMENGLQMKLITRPVATPVEQIGQPRSIGGVF